MPGPVKRSVTIAGHRTSITLEPAFWDALRDIAAAQGLSVSTLIGEIDTAHSRGSEARPPGQGLSSALRVYILNWYRSPSRS
ncbi:MAG: ribbon-helix-helix domain-containing protein [Alphaproteobacteria bacterium]